MTTRSCTGNSSRSERIQTEPSDRQDSRGEQSGHLRAGRLREVDARMSPRSHHTAPDHRARQGVLERRTRCNAAVTMDSTPTRTRRCRTVDHGRRSGSLRRRPAPAPSCRHRDHPRHFAVEVRLARSEKGTPASRLLEVDDWMATHQPSRTTRRNRSSCVSRRDHHASHSSGC